MQAVNVVFLIAFLARAATVFAQNSIAPQVITGAEPGTCPSQEDRDTARQNLQSAVSSVLQQSNTNGNTSRCGPGQWYRVAYLNMSDPTQQCPSALREYRANGVRACGRPGSFGTNTCSNLTFASNSRQYSKVCGQVIGYQIGSTDIFANRQNPIDTAYVDGVSVTYGSSPRAHIWTYAAGLSEQFVAGNAQYTCSCVVAGRPTSSAPQTPPPSFVGNSYYCESGNPTSTYEHTDVLMYTDDPIWDGQQCEGQCCTNGRSPPWFSVTLANPTSDAIEVRICGSEGTANEDTPIKILELYVQ